jgi:V/A-type H+-transporting ATPase subunit K
MLTACCFLAFEGVTLGAAEPSVSEPVSGGSSLVSQKVGLGIAAALAISLCVCGAAYAVSRIGSAAMGAAAEKPELLNRSLLFVALAEGLAVLGFVVAVMILQKI